MKQFTKTNKFKIILAVVIIVIILIGLTVYYFKYPTLPEFTYPLIPSLDLSQSPQNILIFSPHCDDEILGSGGLIAQSIKRGDKVVVVLITNGDGHRYTTFEEFKKIYPKPEDYINVGYKRQQESIAALEKVGLYQNNIIFLGYPDSGIDELLHKYYNQPYLSPYTKQSSSPYSNSYHENVLYTGQNLASDISNIIKIFSPTVIVAPSSDDSHPDHAATAQFVRRAVKDSNQKVIYLSYLVHYNRYPYPKGFHTDRYLMPPARLIKFSDDWRSYNLDPETVKQKEGALSAYQSQLKDSLLKNIMESFLRRNELFQELNLQ